MKFEDYAHEANRFVHEISQELGIPGDTENAKRIMTSVLHTLREIISPEESMHLISQLPMMIKAVYINGWHLERRNRIRNLNDFVECLLLQNPTTAGHDFGNDAVAVEKTRAVLKVLKRHVAEGEIRDIINQFPSELKDLWMTEEEPV